MRNNVDTCEGAGWCNCIVCVHNSNPARTISCNSQLCIIVNCTQLQGFVCTCTIATPAFRAVTTLTQNSPIVPRSKHCGMPCKCSLGQILLAANITWSKKIWGQIISLTNISDLKYCWMQLSWICPTLWPSVSSFMLFLLLLKCWIEIDDEDDEGEFGMVTNGQVWRRGW